MEDQANVFVEQNQLAEIDTAWTGKILAIGGVLGALTGLAAAYLLVQRSKKTGERPTLEFGESIKLGVLLFGLLRNIALLGDHE